ncbi:DUF6520 family protein [Algoriphagus halophytocola]|uniref:Uncharacterized protein n=1 Tax=Algoriphagus halophytocola TaxID=2991499 RepID=A0ABY6MES5_9BACT|nr:hypothetical protein [Algoriphagus sp. TR-M5]UZD22305.1 hypothetical protein OM944_16790 [Algoriphagus sp. TR-M5]
MNKLSKLLPALGLVLGATMAMAMNVPTMMAEKTATKVWTPDSHPDYAMTNGYREITNEEILVDYECDESSQECAVEFVNDNPFGTIENLEEGTYVAL